MIQKLCRFTSVHTVPFKTLLNVTQCCLYCPSSFLPWQLLPDTHAFHLFFHGFEISDSFFSKLYNELVNFILSDITVSQDLLRSDCVYYVFINF